MENKPILLDGKALSNEIEANLRLRVDKIIQKTGKTPVLATILVGNDPSSEIYVKMKGNAYERVGMKSLKVKLPEETTTEELLLEIDKLNKDENICGILLQHPVPKQIDERVCFDKIAIDKDVDGVTCLGFGRMSMGEKAYRSATPEGIMELIKHYKLPIEGKNTGVHMMLAQMRPPEYPMAFGVIREVKKPTYNQIFEKQMEEVKATSKIKCFDDLLNSGETWEI